MTSGTPGFIRFAERMKRIQAVEAEQAQDLAVLREQLRASVGNAQAVRPVNLTSSFSQHRDRGKAR